MVAKRPDVIVAGLGAVGGAAAWQLAGRGLSVLGLDRHRPPHDQGSSHGETRITRTAIGEGDRFVPLVRRADALIDSLADRAGRPLRLACGGLFIGAAGGTTTMHGRPGFIAATADTARRFGVSHEILTPAEVRARFPAFHPADDDLCYFEPGAGLLFPERIVAAQLDAAAALGADLRYDEPLIGFKAIPGGVRVTTPRGTVEAGALVLAAGAWTQGLLPARPLGTALYRQVLHWFAPHDPARFAADRCPVFIWAHGSRSDDCFYGFPLVPGADTPGVKIATENFSTAAASPDAIDRTATAAETAALGHQLAGRLSGLAPDAMRRAVCLYTATPDAGFILGRLPEAPAVTLVSACSGHGFKHAAAVGEAVAHLVASGAPSAPDGFSPPAQEPRP